MADKRKQNPHYVDNKAFYQAMVEYKQKCNEAEAAGLEQPKIPNFIAECIYKISTRLSYKYQFINYTYREDMVADGLATCIANIKSFNPEKTTNPFAYFTRVNWNAFIHRIQEEKKQQYVKYKSLEHAMSIHDLDSFTDSDGNPVVSHNYAEAMSHVVGSYEASMQKKKDAFEEKKKQKALDRFLESEEEDV